MQMSVTVELIGGLGNQLFQIATAYAYAKIHEFELYLPSTWNYPEDRPPVWKGYLDSDKWKLIEGDTYNWFTLHERGFKYNPIPYPPYNLVKLSGYFQSSQYFNDYKEELRILFQPQPELKRKVSGLLVDIGIRAPGWVGAHVRRGDYLKAADYHLVCTKEYYKGARSELGRRLGKRVVCWITDDTSWVYANLYEEGDKVICNKDPLIDFTILQNFQHMILSNSSFSWWSAFLSYANFAESSERLICSPNRWFGPAGPQDYETVFEPGWLLIDTMSGNFVAQV